MKKKHHFTEDQKWILFGGSYSGALAMWMKEKYPNLVAGAVGSSGPVYLQVDFKGETFVFIKILLVSILLIFLIAEYLVTTGNVMRQQSPSCAENTQAAFEKLDSLLNKEGSSGEREVDNLFP